MRVATFAKLFRAVLPDLYTHMEEEQVDINDWARSWLETLLAKELPMPCTRYNPGVIRLWDCYFSNPSDLDFHLYICLAILARFKENLEGLLV